MCWGASDMQNLSERIHYTWDFNFGHAVTIIAGIGASIGMWYTQIDKIDDNSQTLTLHELRMDRMEAHLGISPSPSAIPSPPPPPAPRRHLTDPTGERSEAVSPAPASHAR